MPGEPIIHTPQHPIFTLQEPPPASSGAVKRKLPSPAVVGCPLRGGLVLLWPLADLRAKEDAPSARGGAERRGKQREREEGKGRSAAGPSVHMRSKARDGLLVGRPAASAVL